MKVAVITLGCKVNYCESETITAMLLEMGHAVTNSFEYADVYIINTCSVTKEADKKSRQTIARAIKLNSDCDIIIVGCSSQNNPEAFASKPNVRYIIGTGNKLNTICDIMSDIHTTKYSKINILPLETEWEYGFTANLTRARAFIKVQDGCDNFCSYCIVPYLRGRARSRSIESVIAEVNSLDTGEAVIGGINLSSYGKDINSSLIELVKELAVVKPRKRLGSLECTVIDKDLLSAMKNSGFCDHFHLSLQSGSQSVLSQMNRKYTPEYFFDKVNLIRQYFPDAAVTTDIIVGFPTETEQDFDNTVNFAMSAKFSDIHIFPYSPRKGTVAYAYTPLADDTVKRRVKIMTDVKDKLKKEFITANLNKKHNVYVEANEGEYNTGYTANYIKVYTTAEINKMYTLSLIQAYKDGALA